MDKYTRGILTFGYMPMLMILEDALAAEDYHLCQQIENALSLLEIEYGIEYPRAVTDETIYDYGTRFWSFGLSGEIAIENLPDYKEALIKYLENAK